MASDPADVIVDVVEMKVLLGEMVMLVDVPLAGSGIE